MYEFNISKCIDDSNHQYNIVLADFKYCSSHIRNILFQRYYTSFHGTQMLPHFDTNIQDVYIASRISICRMWYLPLRTHNNMMAHVAVVMEPELWFAKRCIKFIKMALIVDNNRLHF